MEIFIVPLAVIAAVAYIVVRWRRGGGTPEAVDPGIGTVRRLYFYTVSFVALMVAANGVVQVGQFLLDGLFGEEVISPSRFRLAIGLSLTIVGLPSWAWHWHLVSKYVREPHVEARSLVRKFYLYLVLGVALGLLIWAGMALFRWIFRSDDFSGYPLAAVVVWSAVWALHWRLENAEGQPNADTLGIRRFYTYAVSLVTLVLLATGLGRVIHIILLEGYESLASLPVLLPGDSSLWRSGMRDALAMALVGGAVWTVHWLRFARRDQGSLLRRVYLFVFAVPGGMVTVLVALGTIIYGLLVWGIGTTDRDAASHFRFLPAAVASLSMGLAIAGYHWSAVRREAYEFPSEWLPIRRGFSYLMVAIGLGGLAVGVATLGSAAIDILATAGGDTLAGSDVWRNRMALGITNGLLGGPLWGYFWPQVQRQAGAGGADERESLPRRVLLFIAIGVGALALLGSLSHVMVVVLVAALDSELSREVLQDSRISLGILMAVAIFLPYYWLAYRADRRAAPREPERPLVRPKAVSVLLGDDEGEFVTNLEMALGYHVSVLRWADGDAAPPALSAEDLKELADDVGQAPGANVLLVPGETAGIRVLSYH